MKKITFVFAALAVSFALCFGLFISCDMGEDNSQLVAAYIAAGQRQREAEDYTKLTNIAVLIHGSGDKGDIAERDQRRYRDRVSERRR